MSSESLRFLWDHCMCPHLCFFDSLLFKSTTEHCVLSLGQGPWIQKRTWTWTSWNVKFSKVRQIKQLPFKKYLLLWINSGGHESPLWADIWTEHWNVIVFPWVKSHIKDQEMHLEDPEGHQYTLNLVSKGGFG